MASDDQVAASPAARPASGGKYVTPDGVRAVKDGIRPHAGSGASNVSATPPWLWVRLPGGES